MPWFLPALVAFSLLAALVSPWTARAWRIGRIHAWLLLASTGLVLAATLTPLRSAFEQGATQGGTCDLSRIGLISLSELTRFDDPALNVALFIPLGLAIGSLPRSRPALGALLVAIALPFAIELTQLVVVPLNRACQSADVFDNLTGLVIGLLVGAVIGWALRSTAPRKPSDGRANAAPAPTDGSGR